MSSPHLYYWKPSDFLFASLADIALQKLGSTCKGKNLLLGKQILLFKSGPLMRMERKMKIKELLPLKVYPYTLKSHRTERQLFVVFNLHHI